MLISGIQPFSVLDYPGKVSCIVFTPGCNFRCGYCHNPEFVLPEKLAELRENFVNEDAFFNFLKKRGSLLDGVVITGGEPTLMPDLEEFIVKLKERKLLVKLDSNGNRPAILKNLVAKKLVDYIAMDVKTSLAGYQKLAGRLVVEKNLEDSINFLKQGLVDYEFRTTLVKEVHTPEVLKEMTELVKGAKKLFFQAFRPATTLSPEFASYTPFSDTETNEIAATFRKHVEEVGVR